MPTFDTTTPEARRLMRRVLAAQMEFWDAQLAFEDHFGVGVFSFECIDHVAAFFDSAGQVPDDILRELAEELLSDLVRT
jgi:hypothetical protein